MRGPTRVTVLRLFAVAVFAAFPLTFVRSIHLELTRVETGECASSVPWLPDTASNVSYYRTYMNTAYEFDMEEDDFRDWSRWELKEISDPITVRRYLSFSSPPPAVASNLPADELSRRADQPLRRSVRLTDGLCHVFVQDNGGGIWLAYDRRSGRAYYRSAPR